MDEISSKAISIGVSIFITLIIISGVFLVVDKVKDIYGQVYETDISIQNSFSQFAEYDNAEKTGIDMINVAKKYLDNKLVKVYKESVQINSSSSTFYKDNKDYDINKLTSLGKEKYTSSIVQDDSTGITTITFKKV